MTTTPILILSGKGKTGRRVVELEDAESVRDLFAVIRNHRSEYVSEGVQQVLGRAPRDFADWARETAKTGVWSA